MNHTPTPWYKIERPGSGLNIEWGQDTREIRPICHMRWTDGLRSEVTERVDADAEFIVRAVNSHQALVEALEAALYTIKALDEDYDVRPSYIEGEAALKLAKA